MVSAKVVNPLENIFSYLNSKTLWVISKQIQINGCKWMVITFSLNIPNIDKEVSKTPFAKAVFNFLASFKCHVFIICVFLWRCLFLISGEGCSFWNVQEGILFPFLDFADLSRIRNDAPMHILVEISQLQMSFSSYGLNQCFP